MNICQLEDKEVDNEGKNMNAPVVEGVPLEMLVPSGASTLKARPSRNEHRRQERMDDDNSSSGSDSVRKRPFFATSEEPGALKGAAHGRIAARDHPVAYCKKARQGVDDSNSSPASKKEIQMRHQAPNLKSQSYRIGRTSTILHNDLLATYDDWLEHADHLIKENFSELPKDISQQVAMACAADRQMSEPSGGADSVSSLEMGSRASGLSNRSVPLDDVRHRLALMLQECNIKINSGEIYPSLATEIEATVQENEEHEFDQVVKNFMNDQKLPGQTGDFDGKCSTEDISRSSSQTHYGQAVVLSSEDIEQGKMPISSESNKTVEDPSLPDPEVETHTMSALEQLKANVSYEEKSKNSLALQQENESACHSECSVINEPNENDVICGVNAASFHLGNTRFSSMLLQVMASNKDLQSFAYNEVGVDVSCGQEKDINSSKGIYNKRSRSESPNQGASFKSNRALRRYKMTRRTKSMPDCADWEHERRCERRTEVAQSLVSMWHGQSPPGRFIERIETKDVSDREAWRVVDNPVAHVQSWLLANPMTSLP